MGSTNQQDRISPQLAKHGALGDPGSVSNRLKDSGMLIPEDVLRRLPGDAGHSKHSGVNQTRSGFRCMVVFQMIDDGVGA